MTGVQAASAFAPRLGRARRLDRCTTSSGQFAVCAIDHPLGSFALSPEQAPDVATVAAFKAAVVGHATPPASAVLVDPEVALPQLLAGGRQVEPAVIVNAELLDGEYGAVSPRGRRAGWEPEHMVALGADAVKYVFVQPDEGEGSEDDDAVVAGLIRSAHLVGLPVIVEPLQRVPDRSAGHVEVTRFAGRVIAAAVRQAELGADVLKVQFPGRTDSGAATREVHAACRELSASIDVPWTLLSEGVPYDGFLAQLRVASACGASGFMAGRAVWGDVDRRAPFDGMDRVTARFTELARVAADGASWRSRTRSHLEADDLGPAWWSAQPAVPPSARSSS